MKNSNIFVASGWILLPALGLSLEMVTEEVLEANNKRNTIPLEFKQTDGGLMIFAQARSVPVYHLLFINA